MTSKELGKGGKNVGGGRRGKNLRTISEVLGPRRRVMPNQLTVTCTHTQTLQPRFVHVGGSVYKIQLK